MATVPRLAGKANPAEIAGSVRFLHRTDFLALLDKEPLHPGIIIIVPNVTPVLQRELFKAALDHIGARDLINTVIEVKYVGDRIACSEYALPESTE